MFVHQTAPAIATKRIGTGVGPVRAPGFVGRLGVIARPVVAVGRAVTKKNPVEVVISGVPVAKWVIQGVTRDGSGVALGGCTVHVFLSSNDARQGLTVSDGSGNYSVSVQPSAPHYCVAYLAGSPDVAGTTVNTLTGTQV